MSEREKYAEMWARPEYRAIAETQSPEYLLLSTHNPIPENRSVIVFGCGSGAGVRYLQSRGCQVTGVDIAHNCLDDDVQIPLLIAPLWDPLPLQRAQWGVCVDVLEHLPPERLERAVENMMALVDRLVVAVSTKPSTDSWKTPGDLHLTVRPDTWWLKFLERFAGVQVKRGYYLLS